MEKSAMSIKCSLAKNPSFAARKAYGSTVTPFPSAAHHPRALKRVPIKEQLEGSTRLWLSTRNCPKGCFWWHNLLRVMVTIIMTYAVSWIKIISRMKVTHHVQTSCLPLLWHYNLVEKIALALRVMLLKTKIFLWGYTPLIHMLREGDHKYPHYINLESRILHSNSSLAYLQFFPLSFPSQTQSIWPSQWGSLPRRIFYHPMKWTGWTTWCQHQDLGLDEHGKRLCLSINRKQLHCYQNAHDK